MMPETRMLAASIGKTIWGAIVLALEADGLISRSDLVTEHPGDEPWFTRIPNASDITVGHLLTHTSGLPDHVHMDGVATELIAMGREDRFNPPYLVSLLFDEPALFEAGTAWGYTDNGYILLGLVLETVTDADVFELAAERFLVPLGLTNTMPSNTSILEGIAVGYVTEDNPFGLAPRTMGETATQTRRMCSTAPASRFIRKPSTDKSTVTEAGFRATFQAFDTMRTTTSRLLSKSIRTWVLSTIAPT
ncbi:serine hydrolase [Roseobacter sp. HKCCD9010]|uniref:serine hydrolase domain-containing protein n=2 Tax=Roseobacter TaxID=2433 RepID=UPI0014909D1C|nr:MULTISPECIES: serine hydrolase domain-containing protein [unclassified Roseobacter]MBF9049797.1 serine hydrolase [Rhodobacterales bacterium HKCCD4356]NNV13664.1 serine hydrolase [Roseobacter sp. HKCCD7357]NNV16498.1 serine hydrolase [Roseobacter sp. HKCCD8768]NNV25957.1 serine hydrolase [Roseobacter sp. HKCCD8192]NNV30216.1 serine hydrolase [Roseobacter sp. HKCCD9061]